MVNKQMPPVYCQALRTKDTWSQLLNNHFNYYRIYSCISRPFTTKIWAQKIALELYTSHTQTWPSNPKNLHNNYLKCTRKNEFSKPVLIVVDFRQFSEHSSSTKKCEIINVKWFKCKTKVNDQQRIYLCLYLFPALPITLPFSFFIFSGGVFIKRSFKALRHFFGLLV